MPTLANNAIEAGALHEALRYDAAYSEATLRVTVAAEDDGWTAVRVQTRDSAWRAMTDPEQIANAVRQMLAHYPVPAMVNGVPVDRTPYSTKAQVLSLGVPADSWPQEEFASREILVNHDKEQYGANLRYDGVTYHVTSPRYILQLGPGLEDLPHLSPTETILATDPNWPVQHVRPTGHYRISHRPDHSSADAAERNATVFAMIHGYACCLLSPAGLAAVKPQLEASRALAREHAWARGWEIHGADDPRLTEGWGPGYTRPVVLLGEHAVPVTMNEDAGRVVNYALARALYKNDVDGLVPVHEDSRRKAQIRANLKAFTYRDAAGKLGDQDTRFNSSSDAPGEFAHGSELRVAITVTDREGALLKEVVAPADLITTGWFQQPCFVVDHTQVTDVNLLAALLVGAFQNHKNMDEHHETEVRQTAYALAVYCLEGPDAGFRNELQEMADRFRTWSPAPAAGQVAVTSSDGRFRLTWEPLKG